MPVAQDASPQASLRLSSPNIHGLVEGILSFRKTFANATSETLYRFATLIIRSAQVSS
jgi:hypothetical protein